MRYVRIAIGLKNGLRLIITDMGNPYVLNRKRIYYTMIIMPKRKTNPPSVSRNCAQGKCQRKPFRSSKSKEGAVLELLQADCFGPIIESVNWKLGILLVCCCISVDFSVVFWPQNRSILSTNERKSIVLYAKHHRSTRVLIPVDHGLLWFIFLESGSTLFDSAIDGH